MTRITTGNPELDPSGSERRSIGFEARRGPSYFLADWYRLTTSDLPGRQTATSAMLNHPSVRRAAAAAASNARPETSPSTSGS